MTYPGGVAGGVVALPPHPAPEPERDKYLRPRVPMIMVFHDATGVRSNGGAVASPPRPRGRLIVAAPPLRLPFPLEMGHCRYGR